MKNTFFAFLILLTPTLSHAALECENIGYQENTAQRIAAAINNYTHIKLPENIMRGTNPIVGNPDLWKTDAAGPHVYVKPTNELKLGSSTSVSVVGESGKSYDFIFERVDSEKLKTTCYNITEGLLFSGEQRSALTTQSRGSSDVELASLWRDRYESAQTKYETEKRDAILEALRKYRFQIYTRYTWGKGKGFIGTNLISDVYDDGRFTYIRVYDQNKGIMMIEAELAGQVEIIEADYDTVTRMYTVSGIFPEFTLKYGKTKLKVSRQDNKTHGEY